jgi:hypothetical protein
VVSTGNGAEVLIGDVAYKPRLYLEPDDGDLPPGQASPVYQHDPELTA